MKNEMTWIRERGNEVINKTKGILESIYVFFQQIIFQIYYTKHIFHPKNNYNKIGDYKIVTFREWSTKESVKILKKHVIC